MPAWNADLPRRAISGGKWIFALRLTERLFGFVRTVILARLLAPDDFGLMGIALLVILILEVFSETGIQAALIHRNQKIEPYFDTAWTLQAGRGIIQFGIVFVAAPYVAQFFHVPSAAGFFRVIAIAVLMRGFSNVGVVVFSKELEFNKQYLYQTSGIMADFAVSILAVFLLRNVWALAFGHLAGNLARCLTSYIIHPYRPHLKIEKAKARDLLGFGKWVTVSSILVFIGANGDDAVVGKALKSSALGFYQMAYRISQIVISEVVVVLSRVSFPVYAKLQDSLAELQKSYSRLASFSSALTIPMATGILLLGRDVTQVVLGAKWLPMVPALSFLAVAALLESVVFTGTPLFIGSGNPKFEFEMQLVRAVILVIFILPLTLRWGLSGAALTVVLSAVGMAILFYRKLRGQFAIRFRDLSLIFGPALVSSAVMAGFIYVVRSSIRPLETRPLSVHILFLAATILAAALIYVLLLALFQRIVPDYRVIKDMAKIIKGH